MDDAESVSDVQFSSPPSSSAIENTFRMGQVLEWKRDFQAAISKYLLVCAAMESVIKVNPGARVDMKWVLLSLEAIAKIYERREDYAKSVPFRECLIEFLKHIKADGESSLEDETLGDFDRTTSAASAYGRLFEQIHTAAALPEEPCESTLDLLKMVAEDQQKKKEDRVDRMLQMLDQKHKERVQQIQNSFWRRNYERAVRHPIIAGLLIATVCSLLVYCTTLKPKNVVNLPDDEGEKIASMERLVQQQIEQKKNKKPTTPRRTAKPTPTPFRLEKNVFDL
jgi:hypothetical protein